MNSSSPIPQTGALRKQLVLGLLLALGSLFSSTAALPAPDANRLTLDQNSNVPAGEVSGLTQISVIPTGDPAAITLQINDALIATRTRAPFTFDVDLGAAPIERTMTVIATSRSGRKSQWSRVVNAGKQPLGVTLVNEGTTLTAATTSSNDDPVVIVDFFDGQARFASATSAPYRVQLPTNANIVVATARTKSGAEVAATWSPRGDVHTENFDVRTVPLLVSVTDQAGVTRSDLTSRDFRIFDKGREAKLLEFGKAFDQPVSIALLIDASTSMTYRMRDAANAAKRFVGSIRKPDDQFAVFSIRSVPRREQELTKDSAAIGRTLGSIEASGETALFDALSTAMRELRDEKNRRAIVVLSDGSDTASNRTFDDLLNEAKRAAIPIYVIAFSDGSEEEARALDQMRLLTAETGGFLTVADATKLDQKYREIANDLRAQYAIKYEVADSSTTGEWRPVKVVVNSPRLSARTIRGYFAP